MNKISREMFREKRIALAKSNRMSVLKKDHKAAMIIRKMDSKIDHLKEQKQKDHKELVIIPKAGIHKVLV